jgi:hypothetical protein
MQFISNVRHRQAQMETVVEKWLGDKFHELHPLLQRLHQNGGVLCGQVEISFGHGIAGLLGRCLATRLGIPAVPGAHQLQVAICSEGDILNWTRSFNGQSEFRSEFRPVGHYPSGHWVERSGPLTLLLGVEVLAGGWHWVHLGTRLFGIPLHKTLLPVAVASKRIENDLYLFSVEVSVPLLGRLAGYSGKLSPAPPLERTPPGKSGIVSHAKS